MTEVTFSFAVHCRTLEKLHLRISDHHGHTTRIGSEWDFAQGFLMSGWILLIPVVFARFTLFPQLRLHPLMPLHRIVELLVLDLDAWLISSSPQKPFPPTIDFGGAAHAISAQKPSLSPVWYSIATTVSAFQFSLQTRKGICVMSCIQRTLPKLRSVQWKAKAHCAGLLAWICVENEPCDLQPQNALCKMQIHARLQSEFSEAGFHRRDQISFEVETTLKTPGPLFCLVRYFLMIACAV